MNTRMNLSCKKILMQLYKASDNFGSVFSLPVLYIITTQLVLNSARLFYIILTIIKPTDSFMTSLVFSSLFNLVTGLAYFLIILYAADMPIHQVNEMFSKQFTYLN